MSNPGLPPEILDYIVDFLHDNQNALKRCCLVSKSWIPRTRKHLFADIRFEDGTSLELWILQPLLAITPTRCTLAAFVLSQLWTGSRMDGSEVFLVS